MIQILLLVLSVSALAVLLNKKAEDILPAYLMAIVLAVYGLAILKVSLVAASLTALVVMLLIIMAAVVVVISGRVGSNELKLRVRRNVITVPVMVCAVTCLMVAFSMSTHHVVHWDDLSYWGIYAKNLYMIDRLPLAVENCTISYKDYNPIMQIMEYFFMFAGKFIGGSFNEARLFQVNICFMYVLMLPFLKAAVGKDTVTKRITSRTVFAIVMYVIFPHIFTNQFYYKLGVDYLMSLLFGYGIYLATIDDGDDIFNAFRLIIVLSFLADIKTTGAVLSLFVALFYAVFWSRRAKNVGITAKETEGNLTTADTAGDSLADSKCPGFNKIFRVPGIIGFICNLIIMSVFPLGVYFSWKLWGRRTGNHGYLSDKMEDNVRTLAHIFPSYTKDTVINYIKHVFTYPLTREKIGITAAGIILLCVIVYYIRKYTGKITSNHRWLHIVMMAGLVIFCMAHLYMYLFVFDDWEAAGLLEFDRYINQYLAGVFFYYMINLWDDGCDFVRTLEIKSGRRIVNPAIIVGVLLLALLPYRVMFRNMIPANYNADYESGYKTASDSAVSEWESSPLKEAKLPQDEEHRVMVMANAWSDEFQFFTMAMVPQPVTVALNVPALSGAGLDGFARDLINANGADYVYVMQEAPNSYEGGDFDADSMMLTVDERPLEGGCLYEVVKNEDEIYLSEVIQPL